MAHYSFMHFVRLGLFALMFANLAYLNIRLLSVHSSNIDISQNPETIVNNTDTCGTNCVDEIYSAIQEATSSQKLQEKEVIAINNPTAKEYYISFGSGTNATEEWTTVSGAEAYIDSSKYPNIQSVTFEASLYIPTGNQKAYARLYNVTDKHPVWFSEVYLEGGSAQLLISPKIQLDSGNKLYAVQMKTSLKYQANLLQSRVHITLQ